jgi:hypothetical protein
MITITPQAAAPTRFHPRVEANFMVKLLTNGRSVLAKAEDLSMAGLKLIGNFAGTDDHVTVSIPVPGQRDVVTRATMRRRGHDDAALEFDELDWDDMFVIAKYLHPRLP